MLLLRKYLKRTLIVAGIVVAVMALSLFIAGYFFGDKVKQIIVTEISKKLNIEVKVREIGFSVFRNFPEASVELIDLQSVEKNGAFSQPLLKAGRLSLLFDLLDIFSGDYTIEKVMIQQADLYLEVKSDTENNFTIFHSDASKPSSVRLNLKKVVLDDVDVYYLNQPSDQEYRFKVRNGNFKGAFSSSKFLLEMDGNLFSDFIRSGEISFLKNKELTARLMMNIDRANGLYTLKSTEVEMDGIKVILNGSILESPTGITLDLNLAAGKSQLKTLLGLIPDEYKQSIQDYSLDGELAITVDIDGVFSGNTFPSVKCSFSLLDGSITDRPSGLIFRNVSFQGTFENGELRRSESFHLKLFGVKAGINAGEVEGELSVINFLKPAISVTFSSKINLDKLDQIMTIEDLQSISGKLDLNLKFSNNLKGLHKFTIHDFLSSKTTGSMKISGVSLKLKNSPVDYHNLNGSFKFNNKDLLVDDFSGNINESDFSMTGYFLNMMAFAFLPGEKIRIKADFSSSNLNMDDLLSIRKDKTGSAYRMKFSDQFSFDLNLSFKKFNFGTFTGENITGNAVLKNKKLVINQASLQAMKGTIRLNGSVDGNYDDKFWVSFDADMKNVDISQFFYQLGEFGQQNITSQNIKGNVNAMIYYKSFIDPGLNIDPRSVYALGDIEIGQGELIGYTPLYKLSKYLKNKELEHIRFSTLKNQIEIKEEVVYIPEMDIESTTLNLSIMGNHSFENTIDYHVRVLLSELLSKRDKKKEEDIEGIFAEDDGLGRTTLYLHMTGNAGDPDIKYDTREVRKKITADMKKEKLEIKDVFKKEFGGSENKNQPGMDDFEDTQPEAGRNFKIEWDEEDSIDLKKKTSQPAKPQKEPDKKPGKKDFIIDWDEENDTLR